MRDLFMNSVPEFCTFIMAHVVSGNTEMLKKKCELSVAKRILMLWLSPSFNWA